LTIQLLYSKKQIAEKKEANSHEIFVVQIFVLNIGTTLAPFLVESRTDYCPVVQHNNKTHIGCLDAPIPSFFQSVNHLEQAYPAIFESHKSHLKNEQDGQYLLEVPNPPAIGAA
jgi:hypothetical protein